jgi:hypothetical protein
MNDLFPYQIGGPEFDGVNARAYEDPDGTPLNRGFEVVGRSPGRG